MKESADSWRVTMSLMLDRRSDSTTSRFSSPGTPKIRSTPSFSKAEISRSEPFIRSTPSRPWAFAPKSEADALRQVEIKRVKEDYCPSTAKERNVAYLSTIFRNAMYSGLLHQE